LNVEALSKQQILELLAAARAYREAHWLAILVGYLHGLRATEVVSIKRVDLKDGYITVRRGKRSEVTVQALISHPNPLLNERTALIEYALKQSPIHPLFNWTRQTFWNILQRHGKTIGLPEHQCHPHILKESIATHMFTASKDLPAVQKWLGHVSGASTMIYMRKTQSEAARVVMDCLN
jgi:integrase/recombinase XerD